MQNRYSLEFWEEASATCMQQDISDVDKKSQAVGGKQYRVEPVYGITENHKWANGADNPEAER